MECDDDLPAQFDSLHIRRRYGNETCNSHCLVLSTFSELNIHLRWWTCQYNNPLVDLHASHANIRHR